MLKIGIIPISIATTALFFFGLSLYFPFSYLWLLPALLLILPAFFLPVCEILPKGRAKTLLIRVSEASIVAYLHLLIALLFDACCMTVFSLADVPLNLAVLFPLSAGLTVAALAAGIIHARVLKRREVRLSFGTGEQKETLRALVFSDLHLGFFTTRGMLERLERAAKETKPDVILFAGDLFDSDFGELRLKEDAAKTLESIVPPLGFYYCEGNHDAYSEGDGQKEKMIEDCALTLLKDQTVSLPAFDLVGRADRKKKDRPAVREVCRPGGKPLFVLDHQPDDAEALIDAGASLVICGHTHNGQTFPGNILAKILGKYNYGLKKYKNGFVLTTAGAGYWGLPVRLFTANEVVVLDLTFWHTEKTS